jgi:eukaryotic-like serine/threonine-protein kinase
MPMNPDEVAELSRLLDEAQALEPALLEHWLAELEKTKPQVAQRLRDMLQRAGTATTKALPGLPKIDTDEAIAVAGERVGPYQLVREIGRGGMGSVWLAERADGTFKRRVALKLPRMTWAAGLGKRMARERDIGALLEHPNIARLYDAGVDEHGRPYIAMEYIDGQPIDVYCRDHALDLRTKLKLFVEVAQAVAYAHGRLVLHRDLKPANVLVDAGGHVHLLDFGIAKLLDEAGAGSDLTQEQGRVLTLNYASPEQIAGRPLGVTADVYSLGVLLFELLAGTVPYRAKRNTTGAMEEAILAGDALLASSRVGDKKIARELRGDLDAILTKAIKRNPGERYQTAEALAADIQRYLDGQAIEARPDSAWYRLRKSIVRHRLPLMAASAVLVVALVGVTTTLMQGRRAADEAERARLATAFVAELFRANSNELVATYEGAPRPTQAVLLERGAKLIEARFEKQPAMKAELYGVVGKVYADLGQDRLASEFATRQLQTLRAQNARSTQIARSLMLLSEVALASEREIDAEDFAQQAVNTLLKDDVVLPDALALLARAQILTGKVQQAAQTATRARDALQTGVQTESAALAWLLYVEGYQLTLQNKFDDALPVFESAIVAAINAEGPTSPAAVEMQFALAGDLIFRSRSNEARPFAEAAIATLEGQGGVHLIRAARAKVRLQAIRLERGVATPGETIALLEDVRAFLRLQSSAVPAEVLAEVDLAIGNAHHNYGEVAQAEPLIDASVQILRTSSQSLRSQFKVAALSAFLKIDLGDHEAADRLLRERMEVRRKAGRGHLPHAAFDWVYIALNLHMQGRHQEAEAFLSTAPSFGDIQGDRRSVSNASAIPAALSRIRLDVGDLRGASLTLPPILPERSDPNERWPPIRWHWLTDPELLHAELMCATDERARGLALLTKRVKIVGDHQSPNGPELARNRSVAGLCALSLGNRKLAEEFAAQARRAFTAQPRVSPYYKEPLKRLEQQLGTKAT